MFKNVAAKFMVFAFDATTNVPKTGDAANITAYVSKDYGTVTVLADTTATEMDATNAPGYYLFDAAQGETNGDCLMVSGKSSTANIKILGAPAVIYTRPTTGWLAPTTAGRTLVVDASGLADANMVKAGPTGSGTAQTAGDIYSKVTGLTFTVANQVDVNVKDWAGTAVSVPTVAGVPNVNCKTWNDLTTVALPLIPTVAGRTLDCSAGGEAGLDWANIGSPTTANALTATSIITTQKVDVDTIKTNPVVNGGTVTFPTNATLASTTNITAGTITTVTNQLTAAQIATGIWQDTTAGDFTTALSVGKSLMNGVALGTGLTVARCTLTDTLTTYTGNTLQTGDNFTRLGAPAGASVSADIAAVKSDTGAVKVQTDKLTFTVANVIDANMLRTNGDATAAANVAKTTRAIVRCTASGVPTTTSIPTSACTPSGVDADQFKGRIITFDADTTTTNLRGQSTDITANTAAATPTFSCTALTVAPAVGDTFSIT